MGMQQGMTYNTTAASVWLDMWNDGGCSILYFIIEYRREGDSEWKLSSKPVPPSDRIYVLAELTPGVKYQLRITAHNNIGSTIQIYNFTTFSEEGGRYLQKRQLLESPRTRSIDQNMFYFDFWNRNRYSDGVCDLSSFGYSSWVTFFTNNNHNFHCDIDCNNRRNFLYCLLF